MRIRKRTYSSHIACPTCDTENETGGHQTKCSHISKGLVIGICQFDTSRTECQRGENYKEWRKTSHRSLGWEAPDATAEIPWLGLETSTSSLNHSGD